MAFSISSSTTYNPLTSLGDQFENERLKELANQNHDKQLGLCLTELVQCKNFTCNSHGNACSEISGAFCAGRAIAAKFTDMFLKPVTVIHWESQGYDWDYEDCSAGEAEVWIPT